MRSRGIIKLSRETTISRSQYSREKKGLSHRRSFVRFFAILPLDGGGRKEADENVRRDRIIHCPIETGGTSRLFGKRIHLI